MPIAHATLALPLRLNPNISMTYHPNCMDTILSGVQQLLIDAKGELPLKKTHMRVAYLFLPEFAPDFNENHLSLSISISDERLGNILIYLLNQYFGADNQAIYGAPVYLYNEIFRRNPRATHKQNKLFPMQACLVIRHPYVPRFLNEICHAVSLYSHRHHTYSLVRDFYLMNPEGDQITVAHDDEIRKKLNTVYQENHAIYNDNRGVQDYAFSESDANAWYQRLNALVHAYHLGGVNTKLQDFTDRITPRDERARTHVFYQGEALNLIPQGDVFYEASQCLKDDPNIKLAIISPYQLLNLGSEVMMNGFGGSEAGIASVSNLLPQAFAQAGLNPRDPRAMLSSLYAHLQPTGQLLSLTEASGVYYLDDQVIPEYIPRHEVSAYMQFAENAMHLIEPDHDYQPHLVKEVKWLDAQGVIRSVSMMGVDLNSQNHRHSVIFNRNAWLAVFDALLKPKNRVNLILLHHAFDFSYELAMKGLIDALALRREALIQADISLVVPLNDLSAAFFLSNLALVSKALPSQQCLGGTPEFCIATIAKKYRELGGRQFDIETKTLPEILAHVFEKDRKSRSALLALNYLQLNDQGELVLHPLTPLPVARAYAVATQDSLECIKERIIEAYKKLNGSKFDIQTKTLPEIMAHALQKNRKTRLALLNLNYLALDPQGNLELGESAPALVRGAYHQLEQAISAQRDKEIIIEMYKQLKGPFFYQRYEAKKKTFDIFSASLEDIIAHAKRKDRKTRQALIALGWVLNNGQSLRLAPGAPSAFSQAFYRLDKDVSEDRIRKNIIAEYFELGGRQADITKKSLENMLTHAFQKDGKTRKAFVALRYLEIDKDGLMVLGRFAPVVLRRVLGEAKVALSEQCIKARIIEAYRQTKSLFDQDDDQHGGAFNLYTATLQEIVAHAKTNDDRVRRALVALGYVYCKPAYQEVVLTALGEQVNENAAAYLAAKIQLIQRCNGALEKAGFDPSIVGFEQMLAYGQRHEGKIRRELISSKHLKYRTADEVLMLNGDAVPALVIAAFNANPPEVIKQQIK